MTKYAKLIEVNENEGETWIFYFPEDEQVIDALNYLTNYLDSYELYGRGYTEEQVDFIVAELENIGGYYDIANKRTITPAAKDQLLALVELLKNTNDDTFDSVLIDMDDFLYKGGLFNDKSE